VRRYEFLGSRYTSGIASAPQGRATRSTAHMRHDRRVLGAAAQQDKVPRRSFILGLGNSGPRRSCQRRFPAFSTELGARRPNKGNGGVGAGANGAGAGFARGESVGSGADRRLRRSQQDPAAPPVSFVRS
jgi:hypothetical protein